MNLRDKFLWNITILLSVLAILWNIWNILNMSLKTNESISLYRNQQVGTDKSLENKVLELENIYTNRNSMKFKMLENPVDLNKVVSMNFGSGSKRRKSFHVSTIILSGDKPISIVRYKDKQYKVTIGDSIAGGSIIGITSTEVLFEKNEKIHTYYLGLKKVND